LAPLAARRLPPAIVAACYAGLDSATLRGEVFRFLQRAVPSQAVWFASVDPATLLPTGSLRLGLPEETASLLRRNEDLDDDVNKVLRAGQDLPWGREPTGRSARTDEDARGGRAMPAERPCETLLHDPQGWPLVPSAGTWRDRGGTPRSLRPP
jgi:hypothetical protein